MKRIILCFVFALATVINISAQGERIFLFDNFASGVVHFKNHAVNAAMMNYDANGGKMYFKQGDELMELTAPETIDSINFGERKFLQSKGDFVELFKLNHGTVKILWRIKKIHEGYLGAYGSISQTGGQKVVLDNIGMGTFAGDNGGMFNGNYGINNNEAGGRRTDIWRNKNANVYTFEKNGKEYSVSRINNIYKKFPEYKEQIKKYLSENNLDMVTADKAIQIIDYILSL